MPDVFPRPPPPNKTQAGGEIAFWQLAYSRGESDLSVI
jgi:hypothetical protein